MTDAATTTSKRKPEFIAFAVASKEGRSKYTRIGVGFALKNGGISVLYDAQPVIALARVISRRAMREFSLAFDSEGRVVDQSTTKPGSWKDERLLTFPMQIGEDTVEVRHTKSTAGEWISFVGEELPPPVDNESTRPLLHNHKPHALSETGWLSWRAAPDAIAVGRDEEHGLLVAAGLVQVPGLADQACRVGRSLVGFQLADHLRRLLGGHALVRVILWPKVRTSMPSLSHLLASLANWITFSFR